ncbi:hypothetical protein PENTCL1PPCAC_28966, partial [Pristionchus entomophagus]
TMKLDLTDFWDEEDDEVKLLAKFITCTPNGVLAFTLHDEGHQKHLFLFNIHTRVELCRTKLPDQCEMFNLVAIDENTIITVGKRSIFNAKARPRVFAKVFMSNDGFRSMRSTEVTIDPTPLGQSKYPDFCVDVGKSGFVLAMRHSARMYERGTQHDFFYASFASIRRAVAEKKSVTAALVASMPGMGNDNRFVVIPYDSTSFAVLKGNSGNSRIEVYDVRHDSSALPRSIPVQWTRPTAFPPIVAHVLPFDGTRSALLQTMLGEKLRLNLQTGEVESVTSFINPANQSLDIFAHHLDALSRNERRIAGYESEGYADDFSEEFFNDRGIETPVMDAVYLTEGRVTVSDSIMGWFATGLMDEYEFEEDSVTILRLPINKVLSLLTLATDAVNSLLSRQLRERITETANPKSNADYIKAIVMNG